MINNLITAPITSSRRFYGKYAPYPGNADLVYDAVCKVLSERKDQVEWAAFTPEDWQMLVMMAKTEGAGPLLYWAFKDGEWPDGMPQVVRDFLRNSYYQTAAQNAVLFQELERILAAFAEAEIPVIVLKGAALAQTVYPDPGLRPMGDLDLLVKYEQISEAIKILLSHHFEPKLVTSHHIEMVIAAQVNIQVELHFEIPIEKQNKTLISADWFWDHKIPFSIGKNKQLNSFFFYLDPSASITYLIGHLKIQHSTNQRLIWIYDLYILTSENKQDIEWENLDLIINRANISSELHEALKELSNLFGLELSPEFSESNYRNKKEPEEILDYRKHALLSSTWKVLVSFSIKTRLLLITKFFFLDKVRIINLYKPQPEWLWPFYYFFRIGHLLLKMLHKLFD